MNRLEVLHRAYPEEKVFFASNVTRADLGFPSRVPDVLRELRPLVNVTQGKLTLRRNDWSGMPGFYVEEWAGNDAQAVVNAIIRSGIQQTFTTFDLLQYLDRSTLATPEGRAVRAAWRGWQRGRLDARRVPHLLRTQLVGVVSPAGVILEGNRREFHVFTQRV